MRREGLSGSEGVRGGDLKNYKISGPKAHPTALRRRGNKGEEVRMRRKGLEQK